MRRVLLLEDDPDFIRSITEQLRKLPDVEVEQYSTAQAVTAYVNAQEPDYFDVIILDYFAPDGTFHQLEIEKFGPQKIIAISSMTQKNQLAKQRGVTRVVQKKHADQEHTIRAIMQHVMNLLNES